VAGNLKSVASDRKSYALAMGKWSGATGSDEMTAFRFASDVKRKSFYPFFDT
jgi:hypothetical protein